MKRNILIILISILFLSCVREKEVEELKPYFEKEGFEGAIVFYNKQRNRMIYHNQDSCNVRKSPAATFEIFLSLVALETGVMKSLDDTLHWDKFERDVEIWNQDHNLMTAFRYSVSWFYRELARRITAETLQDYLSRIEDYGNMKTSGDVDKFWLDGTFKVSPFEQMKFLTKMYSNDLPFSKKNISLVKELMVYEKAPKYTFMAKDAVSLAEKHGWLIGIIEERDSEFFFALNIKMKDSMTVDFLKARYKIAEEVLKHYYLLRE